jgi:transcriptional antiterminator RfaH
MREVFTRRDSRSAGAVMSSCSIIADGGQVQDGSAFTGRQLDRDLFPGPECGDWFVLHTRSRQEKAVADALRAVDVACFLPLNRKPRYYGRRKVVSDLPLFSGYVFMRGQREDAFSVDRADRVASIITVVDQTQLDSELRSLHLALSMGAQLDLYPFLVHGTRVEVRAGPFKGLQGVVDRRLKENRLILQVQSLGQAVSLEMDAELLDPVRDRA